MSAQPGRQPSQADRLILETATGARWLTTDELGEVLEQVAQAGFDPGALERARGRLMGVIWQGRTLTGRDLLPPAEVHYLRHVVLRREWPPGTTLTDYLTSMQDVILDGRSGVLTSRYQGAWQLAVVRRSESLRGPAGFPWVLVDYRLATGHWVTAFQPEQDLAALRDPRREDLRWLRPPR